MRLRVPWDRGGLRTYLVLLVALFGRIEHEAILWGLPLLVLGAALQVYAKGCLHQNQHVARSGPYRFVRHPFYSANLLLDLGLAVMSGQWPLIAALPVWWLLVYLPVMRREETTLSELFPDVYPEYQRRLPRLLPFRRPLPRQGEGFSWRNPNIISDTVLPRLLRALSYPMLFLLVQDLRTRHVAADGGTLLLLSVFLTLQVLAWELKRHLRGRRPILPPQAARPAARLALVLLLLLTAALLRRAEIEAQALLALVGGILLVTSARLFLKVPRARWAAEGVALVAIVTLCELPWLVPVPVLFYTALLLDRRLRQRPEPAPAPAAEAAPAVSPVGVYVVTLALGLVAAVAKELLAR